MSNVVIGATIVFCVVASLRTAERGLGAILAYWGIIGLSWGLGLLIHEAIK